MNGQKRMISIIAKPKHDVQTLKSSFFTCLLDDPYKVRVVFGKNRERTSAFVGNLSSTLIRENIFSRCISVTYDESHKHETSSLHGHDAAHYLAQYWMSQNMDMQCSGDSIESDKRDEKSCLVVIHNVDYIECHVDLADFAPALKGYQFVNGCLFLMTTSKKHTYEALLRTYDYDTETQLVKPLIYRV
jgi:hypothetical protein